MSDFLNALFSLEGKRALVTGATGGLGEAFVQTLAQAGATVGVHGRDEVKTGALCNAVLRRWNAGYEQEYNLVALKTRIQGETDPGSSNDRLAAG